MRRLRLMHLSANRDSQVWFPVSPRMVDPNRIPSGVRSRFKCLRTSVLRLVRAGQAVEEIKHGGRVKGAYGVRQRREDIVEEAKGVGTPKAGFGCVQSVLIEVAQGHLGVEGDVAVLEEIAGGDADVEVALADVCAEEGDHNLGCRAAPYDAAHELQDEIIVDDQYDLGIVACAILFNFGWGEQHCREVFFAFCL